MAQVEARGGRLGQCQSTCPAETQRRPAVQEMQRGMGLILQMLRGSLLINDPVPTGSWMGATEYSTGKQAEL